MYLDLALLAGCALLFSTIAGKVDRSWITGPMVFVLFGFVTGPFGLNWLSIEANAGTVRFLAEITLAIVLFLDAANISVNTLRRDPSIPLRMLLIGLPLTLLLGYGVGVALFSELSWIEIAILAIILVPTDAALGEAVLKNESVPERMRQGLNVESGLNDGICVPVLLLFLSIAVGQVRYDPAEELALQLFVRELGIGTVVGFLVVLLAFYAISRSLIRKWSAPVWTRVSVAALAILCFSLAHHLGGSGFVAAFCGGLLFGHLLKGAKGDLISDAESTGDIFSLITWVLFGSAVIKAMSGITWQMVCYSLLSLTLIRMLPIFISLAGSGISFEDKWFLGWFGPRGLASIVFAIIVFNANLPNSTIITTTAALTILLSIFLHGITANPWAKRLSAKHNGNTGYKKNEKESIISNNHSSVFRKI